MYCNLFIPFFFMARFKTVSRCDEKYTLFLYMQYISILTGTVPKMSFPPHRVCWYSCKFKIMNYVNKSYTLKNGISLYCGFLGQSNYLKNTVYCVLDCVTFMKIYSFVIHVSDVSSTSLSVCILDEWSS